MRNLILVATMFVNFVIPAESKSLLEQAKEKAEQTKPEWSKMTIEEVDESRRKSCRRSYGWMALATGAVGGLVAAIRPISEDPEVATFDRSARNWSTGIVISGAALMAVRAFNC